MAGKPQTLATTSAFEILGPVMVGPSSSHTAGALRCAQVAASLLEGRITKVPFGLWNSFAHTYRGHGTDRALVAGILGLDTDDENIKQAFDLAREQGLEYHFDIKGDDASIHPNTVDIDMVDDTGATAQVRGESLGGGKMRISRINGVGVDISGMYSTLFVAHQDVPGVLAALTNLLAYAHVNIAFCRTYRTEVGGQAYSVFETDGTPDDTVIPMLRKLDNVDYATFIELPGSASSLSPGVSAKEIFDDGEQLLDACAELGLNIGAGMAVREACLTGEQHAVATMRRVLEVMKDETTAPIANPQRSLGGLIGGEAKLVDATGSNELGSSLMGAVQTDAVARAMAVLERQHAAVHNTRGAGRGGARRPPAARRRTGHGRPLLRRRHRPQSHHKRLRCRRRGRVSGRGRKCGRHGRRRAGANDGRYARAGARRQLHRAEQPAGPRLRPRRRPRGGALPKPQRHRRGSRL